MSDVEARIVVEHRLLFEADAKVQRCLYMAGLSRRACFIRPPRGFALCPFDERAAVTAGTELWFVFSDDEVANGEDARSYVRVRVVSADAKFCWVALTSTSLMRLFRRNMLVAVPILQPGMLSLRPVPGTALHSQIEASEGLPLV
jgi:hypothetical protein